MFSASFMLPVGVCDALRIRPSSSAN